MFEASRLKVKRANKHISDFNDTLCAFAESDFYGFVVDQQSDVLPQTSFVFKFLRDPPDDLPVILGDAIHCLRSALDIAFVELVEAVGGRVDRFTMLRIPKDRMELVTLLQQRVLKGKSDVIAMLADGLRCYREGNKALAALHDLDIEDKHRLLIPVVSVAAVSGMSLELTAGNSIISLHDCTLIVDSSGHLNLASLAADGCNINIKNNGKPSVQATFGDGTGLEGNPIIPTLHQFSRLTEEIIDLFQHTVSRSK